MQHICIYHKNCADGFGAALAFKRWADLKGIDPEFVAAHYGDEVPDVNGKDVTIVDFSYPRDVLLDIYERANSILVIDHHKTAQEALRGLDFCIFDMDKSGAVLTWEHFFPKQESPELLKYIQDRDLWKWKLDNSKAVSAALQTLKMDFDVWEQYLNINNIPELVLKGESILEYQNSQIEKITKTDLPIEEIAGYKVPCINATHLISELGNEISKGFPFAAMYFETEDKRIYSLRSADDGIDVSEVAKKFGGGGHFHAAGFSVDKPIVELAA